MRTFIWKISHDFSMSRLSKNTCKVCSSIGDIVWASTWWSTVETSKQVQQLSLLFFSQDEIAINSQSTRVIKMIVQFLIGYSMYNCNKCCILPFCKLKILWKTMESVAFILGMSSLLAVIKKYLNAWRTASMKLLIGLVSYSVLYWLSWTDCFHVHLKLYCLWLSSCVV